MNVAIYARVSTEQQAEKGYSISTQIEACQKKAMELGADTIKVYKDDGYSGAYLERPAPQENREHNGKAGSHCQKTHRYYGMVFQ